MPSNDAARGKRKLVGVVLLLAVSGLVFLKWLGSGWGGSSAKAAHEEALQTQAPPRHGLSYPTEGRQETLKEDAKAEGQSVIQVATWTERPVFGAVVTALTSGTRIGVTGPTGELSLLGAELGSGEISITAEGFVPSEVHLPQPPPLRTLVRLEEGSQITGMVLDPHGLPLGSGVTVMAVDSPYYFDDRALALTLSGTPLISLAHTDENGIFVLRGLAPARKVRLFCAGKGYASFDERKAFAPGPDVYVEIQALPVYGVMLAFHDAAGRQPSLAPMEGRWQGSVAPLAHADPLFTTRLTEELLGLEAGCNGSPGYYDKPLIYTVHEESGDSIALRYRAELPGYAPVDVLVDASRAVGCLQRHEVVLEETCEGFGQFTVVLEPPGRASSLLDSVSAGRECKLHLREVSSGKVLEMRLKSLAPAGFEVIRGVPYGEYSVTFVGPHQLFAYPDNFRAAMNLRVGPNPATLEIDLPETGTLEMEVWKADGSAYRGPLAGTHLRLDGDQLDAFYFSSGPYRIPLLPTGDYRIALDNLFPDEGELNTQTIFVHGKDMKTFLQWRLPRLGACPRIRHLDR
jgi:hypothetical protein